MKDTEMGIKDKWQQAAAWLKSTEGILTLITLLSLIWLLLHGCTATASLAAVLVTGVEGGKHVVDGPLTTDSVRDAGSGMLLNEIDREIVKIRPMATPVDQLSRCAGAKHSGSMIVDYYNVDTKPTQAMVTAEYTAPTAASATEAAQRAELHTNLNDMFDVSDTLLVPGVNGCDEAGNENEKYLVLYVQSKNESGTLNVMAVNGKKIGSVSGCVPTIPINSKLIRMGRAATELDVQTSQFEALPQKAQNYCQIFKMQIEQNTLQKIANKEVGWTMSDQEEAAIYDMRLGMEKNFLFGEKRRLYDNKKKENVLLTGGIWFQAGKEYAYQLSTLNESAVMDMMQQAFTGNAGSKRKVLIGGSALIGKLNQMDHTKVISAGDTVTKWGIDFTEIVSKFGRLYVLMSEVFDECGMAGNGMIIDPEYIQKYSHLPFGTEALDLKSAGVRNSDALVLTEASCLVLRYPKAHMRLVAM